MHSKNTSITELSQGNEKYVSNTLTMTQVKANHKAAGFHFFDCNTMGFFQSHIESELLRGNYFITSEIFANQPRHYKVRYYNADTHEIDSASEALATLELAYAAYKAIFQRIAHLTHI